MEWKRGIKKSKNTLGSIGDRTRDLPLTDLGLLGGRNNHYAMEPVVLALESPTGV